MRSPPQRRPASFPTLLRCASLAKGYGATAARLTPDQKIGSPSLSGLILRKRGAWLALCERHTPSNTSVQGSRASLVHTTADHFESANASWPCDRSRASLPEWLMVVDLRSTAGNCAWARTPQLAFAAAAHFPAPSSARARGGASNGRTQRAPPKPSLK